MAPNWRDGILRSLTLLEWRNEWSFWGKVGGCWQHPSIFSQVSFRLQGEILEWIKQAFCGLWIKTQRITSHVNKGKSFLWNCESWYKQNNNNTVVRRMLTFTGWETERTDSASFQQHLAAVQVPNTLLRVFLMVCHLLLRCFRFLRTLREKEALTMRMNLFLDLPYSVEHVFSSWVIGPLTSLLSENKCMAKGWAWCCPLSWCPSFQGLGFNRIWGRHSWPLSTVVSYFRFSMGFYKQVAIWLISQLWNAQSKHLMLVWRNTCFYSRSRRGCA